MQNLEAPALSHLDSEAYGSEVSTEPLGEAGGSEKSL